MRASLAGADSPAASPDCLRARIAATTAFVVGSGLVFAAAAGAVFGWAWGLVAATYILGWSQLGSL